MAEAIHIVLVRDEHPLMQVAMVCQDEESAWRVLTRLYGILRELVQEESRRKESTP